MKHSVTMPIAARCCQLALLTGGVCQPAAATLYWDGADTSAHADGGNGVWNSTAANWDTADSGGSDSAWVSGADAIFGGTAGTVTQSVNIAAGAIQYTTANYTNALSNGVSLSLTSISGSPALITSPGTGTATPVTLDHAGTVTWNGKIGFGSGEAASNRIKFIKSGTGTFEFSGDLKPQQGMDINDGIVRFVGPVQGAGNAGAAATLHNDAVLDLNGYGINIQKLNSASTATKVTSATSATLKLNAGNSFFDGKSVTLSCPPNRRRTMRCRSKARCCT